MTERTIPAGKFRNACLRLIEEVHRDGVALIVTRRGKPLVRILPEPEEQPVPSLQGTITQAGDIFTTGEDWEADS